MIETPLRKFLSERHMTAEGFASEHGLSAWSVRHWTRGDKEPSLASQVAIEKATGGIITPANWLEWKLNLPSPQQAA